ncbi:MAG: cyclic nucleotide-binding domain-containing protein [SAR324 cluster bacterium]|nr:cyclic nucleotide-binding domain-containing protein [SAR324 cluster bacterium]
MRWDINQYYPFFEIGPSASQIITRILTSYPLTRACVESLGQRLLQRLEFGFFSENKEIILQGDTGKDIFLLCEGMVDVLVNGTLVVQMSAPVLLGDKALVEPKSQRAATIQISAETTSLFIKIPMGFFLRDMKNPAIPDDSFSQETTIFCQLFRGIQDRLFEYQHLQESLWKEANTSLNVANGVVITKLLENRKDMNWPDSVWEQVRKVLADEVGLKWPANIPLNSQTIIEGLLKFLDKKFPREAFKGKETDYVMKKKLLWSTWMNWISNDVLKVLPAQYIPVQIGELELFDPQIYHQRLKKLLTALESRFSEKKSAETTSFMGIKVEIEKDTTHPAIDTFFGTPENPYEFQLESYIHSFEENFTLKFPKRTVAQIAQRVAMIAAECENQFNASIVKMQKFLESAKQRFSIEQAHEAEPTSSQKNVKKLLAMIPLIHRSFASYEKKFNKLPTKNDKIRVVLGLTPTIRDLITSTAIKQSRAEISKAFELIFGYLGMVDVKLPPLIIQKFFVIKCLHEQTLESLELKKYYWIPISPGVSLEFDGGTMDEICQGFMFGGSVWDGQKHEGRHEFRIKLPLAHGAFAQTQFFLILAIAAEDLPWFSGKQAAYKITEQEEAAIMQWFINRHLEVLHLLVQQRDEIYARWYEFHQLEAFEVRLKTFEETPKAFDPLEQRKIRDFLQFTLNQEIPQSDILYSDQLSKKIMGYVLVNTKKEYPGLAPEEISNKAYTRWKKIIAGIVEIIQQLEQRQQTNQENSPKPFWDMIAGEMDQVLETYLNENHKGLTLSLKATNPVLDFQLILSKYPGTNPREKLLLFQLCNAILENYVFKVMEELHTYKAKLTTVDQTRSAPEVSTDIEVQVRAEYLQKLLELLKTPTE